MAKKITNQTFSEWERAVRDDIMKHAPIFFRGNRRTLFYGLIETSWIGQSKPLDHQKITVSYKKKT